MPYIKLEDRENLDFLPNYFEEILKEKEISVGDLNYLITMFCKKYLESKGEKYQTYNDIIGVLECAKLELYRRKVAPYERKKCKDNGEVY